MNIVISGASGMIGRRLVQTLREDRHDVSTYGRVRPAVLPQGVGFWYWPSTVVEPPAEPLKLADAVIHLAGEPIAQRWTPKVKQGICDSRVQGTRNLVAAIASLQRAPIVLICASAIGYYGNRDDQELTESCGPGAGFLPEVCQDWEEEAMKAERLGLRVVRLRTGVALHPSGGALKKMLTPFRLGIAGRLGTGRQWMSWIHLEDLVHLIRFALDSAGLAGAVNAVAPAPVRNSEFTRLLASAVRRPAVFPVPGFLLRAVFGEMASALLDSQRAMPAAAVASGFTFHFPTLEEALADLLPASA